MNTTESSALDAFVQESIGKDALKSLNYQCTGGNNNAKGNNHESYFAVYKLVKAFNDAPDENIEISSQDKAFVDDLVVLNKSKNTKTSYQLKDSKSVYWHKKKGISPYFQRQYKVDKMFYNINESETVLVLAQDSVYQLRSNDIPSSISAHTRCMHFANYDSPNKMLIENAQFKAEIGKICVAPNQTDKLEVVVKFLIGAWSTHGGTERKVSRLMELAKKGVEPDFFKSGDSALSLDPQISKILDKISGMTYTIDNNFLIYKYGDFEGTVRNKLDTPEFKSISDRLINQQPKNAMELFSILMGSGENHD